MTYEEFKAEVLGKGYDIDGYFGEQCWDGFAYYCKRLGYPVIHCTGSGYAEDIWTKRATNGILKYFDETSVMLPGDVAIFKRSSSTPLSHVAIFDHDIDGVHGAFLGQNQGGKVVSNNGGSAFNIIALPYSATYDTAFRPKAFSKPVKDVVFSLEGADISEHNPKDFQANHLDFVIPRVGFATTKDKNWDTYIRNLKDKIKGVYLFSYALSGSQAREEAKFAIQQVKQAGLKNPVIFYDFEYDSVRYSRLNGINPTPKDVQNYTNNFISEVHAAGFKAGVYLNLDYYNSYYKGYDFINQYIWFAYPTSGLTLPINPDLVDIWQYGNNPYDLNRAKPYIFKDNLPTPDSPAKGEEGSVYRLYSPSNGDHLYTTNFEEAEALFKAGWTFEGVAWVSPKTGDPVWRLYNGKHHHFTSNPEEKAMLEQIGWSSEGVALYSGGQGKPIYRLYNPNGGEHILTAKREEHDGLTKAGWYCEGQPITY